MRIILIEIYFASYFHDLESSSIIWKGVLYIGKHKIFLTYPRYNVSNEKGGLDMNFMEKFNDMWDNFENKENYQAYRELDFA